MYRGKTGHVKKKISLFCHDEKRKTVRVLTNNILVSAQYILLIAINKPKVIHRFETNWVFHCSSFYFSYSSYLYSVIWSALRGLRHDFSPCQSLSPQSLQIWGFPLCHTATTLSTFVIMSDVTLHRDFWATNFADTVS